MSMPDDPKTPQDNGPEEETESQPEEEIGWEELEVTSDDDVERDTWSSQREKDLKRSWR